MAARDFLAKHQSDQSLYVDTDHIRLDADSDSESEDVRRLRCVLLTWRFGDSSAFRLGSLIPSQERGARDVLAAAKLLVTQSCFTTWDGIQAVEGCRFDG